MGAKDSPWTVETLIGAAERIIASDPQLFAHPESENKKDLNVRLIRDYVVREFIPRPERMGICGAEVSSSRKRMPLPVVGRNLGGTHSV